jgi:hypothetical protein
MTSPASKFQANTRGSGAIATHQESAFQRGGFCGGAIAGTFAIAIVCLELREWLKLEASYILGVEGRSVIWDIMETAITLPSAKVRCAITLSGH